MLPELSKPREPKALSFKRVFQYFLQGLVILAPIGLTIWFLVTFFRSIDNIVPGLPPGVGFVGVFVLIILIGYLSNKFLAGRLFEFLDDLLEKIPGIKVIYSTVKDFIEAFAGNKRKFNKAVLANIVAPDVWQVGFVTQEDMDEFDMKEYVGVYIPFSYSFAGQFYIIRKENVRPLTQVSPSDALKFAISGGVTEVEEDDKEKKQAQAYPIK